MSRDDAARADSLIEVGRPKEAIDLLLRALATEPDDTRMLAVLARAQLEVDPESALGSAERLVALEPGDRTGHYLAALAHDELGNRKPAVEHARAAAAIAPDDPYVLTALAITASRRSRGRREGMRAAQRAIEVAPDDATGYFAAGAVELHAGHWRRSARWFERALEVDPHNQPAQVNLAIAQQSAGDLAAGLGGTDALLRFDPNDVSAREVLDDIVYATVVHLLWVVLVLLYVVDLIRGS